MNRDGKETKKLEVCGIIICFFLKLDNAGNAALLHVPTTSQEVHLDLTTMKTTGVHNAQNAGTAALLALGLNIGLHEDIVQSALPKLESLPHRMQIGNRLALTYVIMKKFSLLGVGSLDMHSLLFMKLIGITV